MEGWLLCKIFIPSRENESSVLPNIKAPNQFPVHWRCSVAFQKLKAYLSSLPLLVIPINNEKLFMYLAVTPKVVNSVLCALRANKKQHVSYVSHDLNGLEEWYISLKKHILCLIITARKLKQSFQAHTINVITDIPLRHILHKPDITRRISELGNRVKWVTNWLCSKKNSTRPSTCLFYSGMLFSKEYLL